MLPWNTLLSNTWICLKNKDLTLSAPVSTNQQLSITSKGELLRLLMVGVLCKNKFKLKIVTSLYGLLQVNDWEAFNGLIILPLQRIHCTIYDLIAISKGSSTFLSSQAHSTLNAQIFPKPSFNHPTLVWLLYLRNKCYHSLKCQKMYYVPF